MINTLLNIAVLVALIWVATSVFQILEFYYGTTTALGLFILSTLAIITAISYF